jgi:sRNA-binding protein
MTGYEAGQWDEAKKRFTPKSAFEHIARILHSKTEKEKEKGEKEKAKEAARKPLKPSKDPVKRRVPDSPKGPGKPVQKK